MKHARGLPVLAGVLAGLGAAAAVAVWWLCGVGVLTLRGEDPARLSGQAVMALGLARALLAALLCTRFAVLHGGSAAARTGLCIVAPGWPLALLSWSASSVQLMPALAVELALLALVGLATTLGLLLRAALMRLPRALGPLDGWATLAGATLAAAVWSLPPPWA